MTLALPTTLIRAGARLAFCGALAVGLLTSAPIADAHGATATSSKVVAKTLTKAEARAKAKARSRAKHWHAARLERLKQVRHAMRVAGHQKGDPYRYGAAGPGSFDCSGLTYYSFKHAGFSHIPRTAAAQSGYARHISRKSLRRGDLIFFNGGGRVYHVGVYVGRSHGRRMVLHAPYSGSRVRTEAVWTNSWFAGTLRHR
ncbi:C40 family peptidase [Nocardioides sp. URHA0020]|uniref:C40 family peptidase n=1 Tax=Nocardioides sp. URHA0020 TaxID=1380392 RepID=UPI000688FA7E|nr:C40 family peptidase [Nocardioides sp. URHA0020]